MNRKELLEIVKELYGVIKKKGISPNDAKSVAEIFLKSINNDNENGIREYLRTGVFSGSPPEN